MSVTTLTEGVAHEINNIGASLFGFVELAAESGSADPLLSNLFGEIRVGGSRIAGGASRLEALAEQDAERAPITLAACLGFTETDGSGDAFDFRWSCDSSTLVVADPDHARRALRLLKYLALPHLGNGSRAQVSASLTTSESRCESCGAAIPPGGVRLSIGAGQFGNFSDRQRPHRADTSIRRLSLAACAHVTHLAGGHLQRAGEAEPVAVVLPLAEARN